jgi:hypothetical protein
MHRPNETRQGPNVTLSIIAWDSQSIQLSTRVMQPTPQPSSTSADDSAATGVLFIQSRSHFTFLPCAVMAKRFLLVYLSISIIFAMFACVKGCPFMGKSGRALSAHQKKCEAHRRDVAHSTEIRKTLAERGKQRRAIVQQQRNHPKTSEVLQFFHLFGISNLRHIVSPALP